MNSEVVQIGGQVWMAENLNVSHFVNGDPVPEVKTDEEWKEYGENGKPAWCYYNNELDNEKIYGKLYNWYAIADKRGLALMGWHIPSDKEWTRLIDHLGGNTLAGEKIQSTNKMEKGLKAIYQIGFNALPGGCRKSKGGFNYHGTCGFWWSSTESVPDNAWSRYMYFTNNDVNRGGFNKKSGFSVRCVRD